MSVALYWDFENLHASLYEDLQGEGYTGAYPRCVGTDEECS